MSDRAGVEPYKIARVIDWLNAGAELERQLTPALPLLSAAQLDELVAPLSELQCVIGRLGTALDAELFRRALEAGGAIKVSPACGIGCERGVHRHGVGAGGVAS